jgi:hypothetical protein
MVVSEGAIDSKKEENEIGCPGYASRLVQVLFFSWLICSDDVDTGVWARFVMPRGRGRG